MTGTWYPPSLGTGGVVIEAQMFNNPPFAMSDSPRLDINLHRLRTSKPGRDKAILDLLQLHQLGLAPGRPHVRTLMELWGISQPQVSRRMSAIRELGVLWVDASHGCYRLTNKREERQSRQRWEALRRELQATSA